MDAILSFKYYYINPLRKMKIKFITYINFNINSNKYTIKSLDKYNLLKSYSFIKVNLKDKQIC